MCGNSGNPEISGGSNKGSGFDARSFIVQSSGFRLRGCLSLIRGERRVVSPPCPERRHIRRYDHDKRTAGQLIQDCARQIIVTPVSQFENLMFITSFRFPEISTKKDEKNQTAVASSSASSSKKFAACRQRLIRGHDIGRYMYSISKGGVRISMACDDR